MRSRQCIWEKCPSEVSPCPFLCTRWLRWWRRLQSMRSHSRAAMVLLVPLALALAEVKEEPVGLILSTMGGKLLRADTETPLAARAGDLLFAGDGIKTDTGSTAFLFCPA